jgi:hypothetical protein
MLERVTAARDHRRLIIAISSAASDERKAATETRIEWSSKDPATEVNGNGESSGAYDEGLINSIVRACLGAWSSEWNLSVRRTTRQEQPSSAKGSSPKSPASIPLTGGDVSHFGRQTAGVPFTGANPKAAALTLDGASGPARLPLGHRILSNIGCPEPRLSSRLPGRPHSTVPRCCGSKRLSVPN